MLRYEVLWQLQQRGIDASEFNDAVDPDGDSLLHLRGLPNNGIEGIFNGWRFEILRSRNGDVPSPGRSAKRRAYYCQSQYETVPNVSNGKRAKTAPPNVVILWNFDADYETVTIRLAVPRDVSTSGIVSCYYNVKIPDLMKVDSAFARDRRGGHKDRTRCSMEEPPEIGRRAD